MSEREFIKERLEVTENRGITVEQKQRELIKRIEHLEENVGLKLFHDVAQRIMDVGMSVKNYDKESMYLWDSAILNECEYLAYMIRKGKIDYDLAVGFFKDTIIDYYNGILKDDGHKEELEDENKYNEFKWLYRKIKTERNKKEE